MFIWDVAARAADLGAHYTEEGLLPVALTAQLHGALLIHVSPFAWLSNEPKALALLFALMGAAGLSLVLGYRTRTATALCWLLLALLQVRNPMLYFAGDALLRVLLFWGLFVPLGALWSVDARRAGSELRSNRFASLGSAALLLQIATVYWVTGMSKTDPAWFDGTAVWHALHLDQYVTDFGIWLRDRARLIAVLTHGSRMLEIIGPALAFSPVRSGPLRTLVVLAFAGFHVGLWLCFEIGFFQALSIAAWLAFLPGWFWDRIAARLVARVRPTDPGAPALRAPRWLEAAVAVPLVYLVLFLSFSIGGLAAHDRRFELPRPVKFVGRALRLQQRWAMFVDISERRDAWLVVDATLADGRHVDPYRRAMLSWVKEEALSAPLRTFRWRQVSTVVLQTRTAPAAGLVHSRFAEYLCREWNAAHPRHERVEQLDLVAIQAQTLRDSVAPLPPLILHRHPCRRDPA